MTHGLAARLSFHKFHRHPDIGCYESQRAAGLMIIVK